MLNKNVKYVIRHILFSLIIKRKISNDTLLVLSVVNHPKTLINHLQADIYLKLTLRKIN